MVCHLDGADAQAFPATLDNLVSLMLTDLSTSRRALKDRIAAETDWLCSQNVLMRESGPGGVECRPVTRNDTSCPFGVSLFVTSKDIAAK